MNIYKAVFAILICVVANIASAIDVAYSIAPENQSHKISPLIYGTNYKMYMSGREGFEFFRLGGNRLTGYNWENNWSSAGSDWLHSSDNFMIPNSANGSIPAVTYTSFMGDDVLAGSKAMVTLQMAGYVSADGNGAVSEAEVAPSSRWIPVYPRKNTPFSLTPDLNDSAVYMDELVNFLVNRYGRAIDGGVFAYSLDNEPGLWTHTHPRISPNKVGARELVDRSIATAAAAKSVDPSAKIFGPALFGFSDYHSLAEAPDWVKYSSSYRWFIDYYLDQMRIASNSNGKRLVDVLDLHWYSEAVGSQRVTNNDSNSRSDQVARLQSTRSLWDPEYVENSWIGQWFSSYLPLIPKVKESINTYYPGTELAFTEYSYGGGNHISGGVAQADLLGIFGKYDVYAANTWLLDDSSSYIGAAYRLFRNYDGAKSMFGNISVDASMNDKENSSIYASVDASTGDLHLVVLNKNLDEKISGVFNINSSSNYTSGNAFAMTQSSQEIQNMGRFSVVGNNFIYSVPPVSAYHLVLKKEASSNTSSLSTNSSSSHSSTSSFSSGASLAGSSTSSSLSSVPAGNGSGSSGGKSGGGSIDLSVLLLLLLFYCSTCKPLIRR